MVIMTGSDGDHGRWQEMVIMAGGRDGDHGRWQRW